MPGRGSYGPGGKWIHDRAHRIMEGKDGTSEQYGGEKGKQVAYAIATQQAHKLGKTPKKKGGYGTSEGRQAAKAKFDAPKKEYKKTAHAILAKLSASKKSAPYQQTRKGRRPIRVQNLLKKASKAGQDLRSPMMGMTKLPSDESKSEAEKQLKKQQSIGVPKTPKTTSINDPIPKSPGSINLMPKMGSDMSISNDPLVQWLAQEAREKRAMVVEDNESNMPTSPEVTEVQSRPPEMPEELRDMSRTQWIQVLKEKFDSKVSKKKHRDKDYPSTPGQVDKRLRA